MMRQLFHVKNECKNGRTDEPILIIEKLCLKKYGKPQYWALFLNHKTDNYQEKQLNELNANHSN